MSTATLDAPTTVKAYLKPIDSEGLSAFAAKECATMYRAAPTRSKP